MNPDTNDHFITRRGFDLLAEELLRNVEKKIHRHHSERERNKLILQGRWAPPLPPEE